MDLLARLAAGVLICALTGPLLLSLTDFHAARAQMSPLAFFTLAGASLVFAIAALVLTLRPWPQEQPARRLTALCVCFLISLNLSAWAQHAAGPGTDEETSIWPVVVSTLAFQGAALALTHWCLRRHQTSWGEAFGLRSQHLGRAVLWGLLLAVVAVPAAWLLQAGCAKLLTLLHVEVTEQHMVEILQLAESWPERLYLGFAAVILAPAAEETLFRGILFTALKQRGHPRAALWGTSLLFGAIHVNLPSFLPLALLGAALAWLYEKSGSLFAPILAHACFNAANALMLYLTQMTGQNG